MTALELVLKSLTSGGAIIEPGSAEHQYVVRAMGRLTLQPAVILTIEPHALQQLLEGFGDSGLTFFPEASAMEAARRLVSIDIEGCLASDNTVLSITVTPKEVVVRSDEKTGGHQEPTPRLRG